MPDGKPNILVIWGDDIGISNLSCYSDGLMGYRTPNIDRIADEGARFTDYYGEQSCTAGRAAFITGQNPIPHRAHQGRHAGRRRSGCRPRTRPSPPRSRRTGYATGQFGKNHLGDRDEHLPTAHGFDEFFGNLYHLNAEEEPELADYPHRGGLPELPGALRPARASSTPGRTSRRHAAHRGHRPAHQEADGDRRRGVPRRRRPASSGRQPTPSSRSSCGSTPPTCTSAPTSSRRAGARPGGGSRSTTTR